MLPEGFIACLLHGRVETRLDKRPGAKVLVFLLDPNKFSVGVLGDFITDQIEWEGAELFNTSNCHLAVHATFFPGLFQLVVDFTRAEDDFTHLRRIRRGLACIWDEALELCSF